MLNTRITAVFPDENSAESALQDLRKQGVADNHLAIIKHHSGAAAVAGGAAKGVVAGAGIGAIFGLAAAMIPGVGPFIAAGFLTAQLGALGGGAAAGAIVGASAGMVAGALAKAGYDAKEAEFLGREVEGGRVLLAVDAGAAISPAAVVNIMNLHGGRLFAAVS